MTTIPKSQNGLLEVDHKSTTLQTNSQRRREKCQEKLQLGDKFKYCCYLQDDDKKSYQKNLNFNLRLIFLLQVATFKIFCFVGKAILRLCKDVPCFKENSLNLGNLFQVQLFTYQAPNSKPDTSAIQIDVQRPTSSPFQSHFLER